MTLIPRASARPGRRLGDRPIWNEFDRMNDHHEPSPATPLSAPISESDRRRRLSDRRRGTTSRGVPKHLRVAETIIPAIVIAALITSSGRPRLRPEHGYAPTCGWYSGSHAHPAAHRRAALRPRMAADQAVIGCRRQLAIHDGQVFVNDQRWRKLPEPGGAATWRRASLHVFVMRGTQTNNDSRSWPRTHRQHRRAWLSYWPLGGSGRSVVNRDA